MTGREAGDARVTRRTLVALGALALVALLIQLAGITRYGYFRDELYYLASTDHLDWGYVEHPPLSIAVLALVRALLGDSLLALRIVPALLGSALVVLTGWMAVTLGGGTFAAALAATAAVFAPNYLGTCHYYSMNAIDLILWTLAVLALIRTLASTSLRPWLWLGLAMGFGLLNKISMLWFGGGLFAAMVLTGHRGRLATPGPWLAAAIAALLFLPHVIWQVRHGFPTLEFMHNATARKMVAVPIGHFVTDQLLSMGPANAPLWIAGLVFGLATDVAGRGRLLSLIYMAVFVLLAAGGRSRASYLSVAYPMLFAMGAIAVERLAAPAGRAWLKPAAIAFVALLGAPLVPFGVPLLPVETFIRYQAALGVAPRTEEHLRLAALPQQYADMFGWDEIVALVARAYERLTPEERAHCRVFGQNYGEAGAVDVLGRRYGLPHAMSGHNSYWLWGPGDWDGSVLIIIGGGRADNAGFFESIEIVGQTRAPYAMPYENGLDVSIARGLKAPIRAVWPQLKHYI